jgi:hypothetical protein
MRTRPNRALNARLQADRGKWREVIRASRISPQN